MKQAGNAILVLLIGTAALIGGKMLWDKFKPVANRPPSASKPKTGLVATGQEAEALPGFSSAAAGTYCCKDPLCWPQGSTCKCFNVKTGGYNYKKASVCPSGSAE